MFDLSLVIAKMDENESEYIWKFADFLILQNKK